MNLDLFSFLLGVFALGLTFDIFLNFVIIYKKKYK